MRQWIVPVLVEYQFFVGSLAPDAWPVILCIKKSIAHTLIQAYHNTKGLSSIFFNISSFLMFIFRTGHGIAFAGFPL